MTSRRSLSNSESRLSRQTQFIPGHVGGRVASAQPVRRRTPVVGRVLASPATAPDSIGATMFEGNWASTIGFTSPPAGTTTVAVMISGYPGTPDGWVKVASGDGPVSRGWNIFIANDWVQGVTPQSFTFPGDGYGLYSAGVALFAVGGSMLWSYAMGPVSSIADVSYATPDTSSGFWAQCAILTGVYAFESGPTGVTINPGPTGAYAHVSGSRPPYTDSDTHVTFGTVGAYGPASGVTAALWLS